MTFEILIIVGVSLLGLSFISQIVFGVLLVKRKNRERDALKRLVDKFSQIKVLPQEKYEDLQSLPEPFTVLEDYVLTMGNSRVRVYIVEDKLEGQHYFAVENFVFSPRLK